jgi:hypothetical protein
VAENIIMWHKLGLSFQKIKNGTRVNAINKLLAKLYLSTVVTIDYLVNKLDWSLLTEPMKIGSSQINSFYWFMGVSSPRFVVFVIPFSLALVQLYRMPSKGLAWVQLLIAFFVIASHLYKKTKNWKENK